MLTSSRTARTALAFAASVAFTATLPIAPTHAAAAPVVRGETSTVTTGTTKTVNILANDTVASKTQATVRITTVTTGIKAALTSTKAVKVTVPAATRPGTYKVGYRVTDKYGKSGTATLTVKATAASTDPTLRDLIAALPVRTEQRTGYDRDLFRHWIDADSDGCDTRREVLLTEAVSAPTVGSGCALTGGSWRSYYDGVTTSDSSTFDIDHMVALAEGWDSGAYRWTADTRMRFANDLDDPRSLIAVTASSNRSKSDQDPAEWMPTLDQCRYITEWVAVKTRWSLSIDTTEKTALTDEAADCPNPTVKVTKAHVETTSADPDPNPTTSTVALHSITFDPEGDDATYETVTLVNTSDTTVNLRGWKLADTHGHSYTFPTSSIGPGVAFTVHAPTGTDTTTGSTPAFYAGWSAIWNNTGDTATLTRPDGTTADTCTYTDTAVRTATC